MCRRSLFLFSLIFICLTLICATGRSTEQINCLNDISTSDTDSSDVHELTIYVIPSYSKINWESPASLYKSSFESYTKSLFKTHKYSIGHLFIELSTPLLDSVILTSIRISSDAEKRRLVLKDQIGLGILGTVMHGRMESSEELTKKIIYFSKRKQLAFIKYRISKESVLRVIEFIKVFCTKTDDGFTPCQYYGGAFWPRFEKEGAGCSSFGISVMAVAGLSVEYPEWKLSVNIPMNLVGGVYNNNSKIKRRTILKTDKWHNGEGVENVDFIPLTLYDPSLIFKWIIEQRKAGTVEAIEKDNTPGLLIDATKISVPLEVPVFSKRCKNSLFIDIFRNSLK